MASEFDPDPESDLLWLAFRYVAGEMDRAEAEVFEGRMDQDQAAREALAEVVELSGAIASQEQKPAAGLVLPRSRRLVGAVAASLALAAAACLAWLVVAPGAPRPRPNAPVGRDVAGAEEGKPSESVTLAWSKLRQEGAGEKDLVNVLLACNEEPTPGLPDADFLASNGAEDAIDHGLPLWLLDAAALAGHPGAANPAPAPAPVQEP